MISQTKWPKLDFLGLSVVVVDGGERGEMVDSPSGGGGGAIKSESDTVFNQIRDLGVVQMTPTVPLQIVALYLSRMSDLANRPNKPNRTN